MTRLTIICIGVVVVSLMFVGISNAKIDKKAIMGMWLFDEGKGDAAKDSSENGNDGKLTGDPQWVEGKFGGDALEFNGDDFVDYGMQEYEFGGAITVVFWLKHIGGDYRGVINNGYWDDCSWEIRFGREDAGTRLGTRINTDKGDVRLSIHPSADEWHHIALVYDGKKVQFYLDGSAEQEGDLTGEIKIVATPVVMGHNGKNGEWYSGLLDEVAIFNVGLSKDDIKNIMTEGMTAVFTAVSPSGKLSTTWASIKK